MTAPSRNLAASRREPTLGRKVLIAALVIAGALVLYLILRAILPRWWAQRVGDVVDGSLTVGALYGLFIGFVFTLVPVLVAGLAWRYRTERRTWKGWLGWLGLVALSAAPNLMTLNIVINNTTTSGGHAGERTLDTLAPGFRVWSLVGAILSVVAVAGVWYLASSRRRNRRKASELRDELRGRDEPG